MTTPTPLESFSFRFRSSRKNKVVLDEKKDDDLRAMQPSPMRSPQRSHAEESEYLPASLSALLMARQTHEPCNVSVAGSTVMALAVRSVKVWDVKMPPTKKHMVSGHMVPTMKSAARHFLQRNRRLTIEVHGTPVYAGENSSVMTAPVKSDLMRELLSGTSTPTDTKEGKDLKLEDKDYVCVRVWKLSNEREDNSFREYTDDDEDVSTLGPYGVSDDDNAFVEHRSYSLDEVTLIRQYGRTVEIQTGIGNDACIRDIKFLSQQESLDFEKAIIRVKRLASERALRQSAQYRSSRKTRSSSASPAARSAAMTADSVLQPTRVSVATTRVSTSMTSATETLQRGTSLVSRGASSNASPFLGNDAENTPEVPDAILSASASPDLEEGKFFDDDFDYNEDMIHLLVEVVSAKDLPGGPAVTTDPYVKVRMGKSTLHRTKAITKTLDPIWSLETGSLFLVQMRPEEFFGSHGGMHFTIKDYDALKSSDNIGRVAVPHEELLKGAGQRVGYDLVLDSAMKSGEEPTKKAKLYLRFKEATREDVKFMKRFEKGKGRIGICWDETHLAPSPPHPTGFKRQVKKSPTEETLYKVKPYPNPELPEETEWLTETQIAETAIASSTEWIEVGWGEVGRLFVEVIGCDKLPNLDAATLKPRDKTDTFACLVFEDCVVNTDVISDSLSPRWPYWSQRAFAFRIAHGQSNLAIGVFDYDQGLDMTVDRAHDPIGRCTVNLEWFVPGNDYTLTYPLIAESKGDKDEVNQQGTLTLRIRLDIMRPRKVLFSALKPSTRFCVSCKNKVNWKVIHYTARGAYPDKHFNVKTLARHVEELQSYSKAAPFVLQAFMTVWLWRGHYRISLGGNSAIYLPLHSVTAFSWVLLLCWDLSLFPSFFFFCIAWAFLAMNEFARRHPSPWKKKRSYWYYWYVMIFNSGFREEIAPHQNAAEEADFAGLAALREKHWHDEIELSAKLQHEIRKEFRTDFDEVRAVEELDAAAPSSSSLNPLKRILFPIQRRLTDFVLSLRFVRSIVTFEEGLVAWWITTFALLTSIVLAFFPWTRILLWTFRIVSITMFGPWMAIVDRVYFKERPGMSEEERSNAVRARLESSYERVRKAAALFQLRKENAVKYQSMTRYLYGKYLVSVPRFRMGAVRDEAKSQSFSNCATDKRDNLVVKHRVYGQVLKGDMIPVRGIQLEENGQEKPAKRRGLLNSPSRRSNEHTPLLSRFKPETYVADSVIANDGTESYLGAASRRSQSQSVHRDDDSSKLVQSTRKNTSARHTDVV